MDKGGKKWTSPFLPPGEETDWGKNRPVTPVTGDWLTGAWWTYTLLSIYITHKDATQMGPTPGSTALWGGVPSVKNCLITQKG